MTQTTPQNTFENRRRLALLGAGLLLLLLVVVVILFFLRRQGRELAVSTIYLVDSSQRMAEPLSDGDITRLGAAQGFVRDVVSRSSNESVLGLRAFGSGAVSDPCEDTELIVPPGVGTQSEIVTGIDDLNTVSEEAALIPGAIAAIRDLAQLEEQGLMRLVIVTGGDGTCLNQSIDLLVREANREDINLETIIINIGPAGRDVVALRSLVEELEGAILIEADDPESLGQIGELIEQGGVDEVATLVAANPTATLSTSTPLPAPTETPLPEPPTIAPTNTPTAAASTSTPVPPATPTPAGPAEPTNTPRPTNTPGSTNTPGPTATPQPTSTVTQPAGSPTPTATPRRTNTPQPTRTATATQVVVPPPPTNTPAPPPTSPPPTSTPPPTVVPPTPTFTPTSPPPTSGVPATLSILDGSVTEGPNSSIFISVVRSAQGNGQPVSVSFSVLPDSAFPGSDFTPLSGQLSWGPFEVGAKTFEIPIINDSLGEPTETFIAIINNPVNATIARPSATITIFDDDVPNINHTQQHFYITESSGSVSVELSLGSQPSSDVIVPLQNFSPSFCTLSTNQIVINASNFGGASVQVTILNDGVVDGDPSSLCYIQTEVSTSSDPQYNGINPADFNINIFDDDALYVTTQCTDNDGSPGCDEEALVYRTVQAAINGPPNVGTVYIENGTYTESGINVTRNLTISGDGLANSTVQGAGTAGFSLDRVFNIPAGRTVTIERITVRNGNATGNGGAILNSGNLTVRDVYITGGQATATGGGIFNGAGGVLSVQNTTIDTNQATAGGGIDNQGSLFVVQSTISRNQGGGIQSTASFDLRNSTVSTNSGAGVTMAGGTVTFKNSTIALNSGPGLAGIGQTQNSIFDQNGSSCTGTLTSIGYNVVASTTGCSTSATTGDHFNTSANLGGLANNGGLTQTHLPQAGSVAINGGNPAGPSVDGSGGTCLTVDQRGNSRPAGPACDIGSTEQ